MKALLVFAFLSAFTFLVPASARIGETVAQITERYGAPVDRKVGAISSLTYSVDGWMVTCDFVNGVCARASYAKPGEWTPETFEKLLTTNGELSRWTECSAPNLKKLLRVWKRDDGSTATW